MNPFVNFNKRDIQLPSGCKDLQDLLKLAERKDQAGSRASVIVPQTHSDTLENVHLFVSKLLFSPRPAVLEIASFYGQMRLMLYYSLGNLAILPAMGLAGKEREVVNFFAARGIRPSTDFLAGGEGLPTRILAYPLACDSRKAAELTTNLMRFVYGLNAEDEIRYTCTEIPAI